MGEWRQSSIHVRPTIWCTSISSGGGAMAAKVGRGVVKCRPRGGMKAREAVPWAQRRAWGWFWCRRDSRQKQRKHAERAWRRDGIQALDALMGGP